MQKKNLLETHPEIIKQWHYNNNGDLRPEQFTAGSNKYVWWICEKEHIYKAKICHRASGSRCPYCYGKRLAMHRSLSYKRPDLAEEFDLIKNFPLTPDEIHSSSRKMVWWVCKYDKSHKWQSTVDNRNKGNGCPFCANKKVSKENSLAEVHPELIPEWHPTKNGILSPYNIVVGSNIEIWWICVNDHVWKAKVVKRTGSKPTGCPYCSGNKVDTADSIAVTHPKLAKEWHPFKNGTLSPNDVSAGSSRNIWWQCSNDTVHEWTATPHNRLRENAEGCLHCRAGWSIEKLRFFVASIVPYISTLDPAEVYVLFRQHKGLLETQGKGRLFVQALKSGKFPREELEKFANSEPSVINEYIASNSASVTSETDDIVSNVSELFHDDMREELPVVQTKDILASLDSKLMANADAEAIDFFIKSALAKIWRHAFYDEQQAWVQLEEYRGKGVFPEEVQKQFRQQYQGAQSLTIPAGYKGLYLPNLMQRYLAYLVQTKKRIGNWSGTGAGKTLSAILASRVINARVTVICCPNNVIDTWERSIKDAYPDSLICVKKVQVGLSRLIDKHHYLILNYEFFQQPNIMPKFKALLAEDAIDFIVLDEIHYSKQRIAQSESKRKHQIITFLSEASAKNENLHVLGMSATPVVNELFEGKVLIEMITGVIHDDLDTRPTVLNCVALYKKLMMYGIRYIPKYSQQCNEIMIEVDCTEFLPEIKKHKKSVELEAILTKAKVPYILEQLRPATIVYTHYREGIDLVLQNAITNAGWKVGFFNGGDKEGLEAFKNGSIDILIATSCIGTGIDGLQRICNRLIINCLPWNDAGYQQLIGRLYRQGQVQAQVDIIILLSYAQVNGERWSWCYSRWNRIKFKKTIADAAVDGVIPEGQLRSLAQAHKDAMAWLERLERGEVLELHRQKLVTALAMNDIK